MSTNFITRFLSSVSNSFSLFMTSFWVHGFSISGLKKSPGVMEKYSQIFKNCAIDGNVLPDDMDCM